MTNKLEIGRELAERLANPKDCDDRYFDDIEELRAILAAPVVERQDVQVAAMPVERCYDVRVKMIMAFNEAKKNGGDLDDALDAAYKSALRFSPNPLIAEQPAPVAVVPSLWEIRVRDEPDNPESPCEYVYVSSVEERDSILRRGGASVFAEYACIDKVKELNQ